MSVRVRDPLLVGRHALDAALEAIRQRGGGIVEAYPERLDANLGIPSDALMPILQVLIAGRLKFVVMRGSKFRYRSARLHSYSLATKLDEDDAAQLGETT